ncbi:MAG TPA: hypothetical protein VD931_12420 [Baekduia sp.]|nr:hypothetical protein [Baekduia sp.]
MMRTTGIYASTASRRQRLWTRRRRRMVMLARTRGALVLAWAPAPVLATLLADRWLG